MTIRYTLTADDYVRYNIHFLNTDRDSRKQRNRLRVLFPVLFVLIGVFVSTRGGSFSVPVLAGFAAASVLWAVFFPRFSIRMMRKMGRGNYGAHGGSPRASFTVTLEEDAFVYGTDGGQSYVNYRRLKVVPDGRLTYVYVDEKTAVLIPSRAFEGKVTKEKFFAKLQEMQGKTAKEMETL